MPPDAMDGWKTSLFSFEAGRPEISFENCILVAFRTVFFWDGETW